MWKSWIIARSTSRICSAVTAGKSDAGRRAPPPDDQSRREQANGEGRSHTMLPHTQDRANDCSPRCHRVDPAHAFIAFSPSSTAAATLAGTSQNAQSSA
jgi:hypothetical protein